MRTSLLLILSLVGILFASGSLSIAYGLVVPLSAEEILQTMDLIVLGNVTGVKILDGKAPQFEIVVEQVIKPQAFDASTVLANGCDPNKRHFGTPCPSYEVGERGLFLISETDGNGKYSLSSRSVVSEAACNAQEFLATYRGFEPHFFVTQDGQSEVFFTGRPVDIHYVITNYGMAEKAYSVKLSARTDNADFSKVINGTIGECVGFETAIVSFVPGSMGTYGFSAEHENGGDSFYGHAIIDHGTSPLKQFQAGIHAQDTWCKNDLFLILKNDDTKPRFDNPPACVSKNTTSELVERNWGYAPRENHAYEDLESK